VSGLIFKNAGRLKTGRQIPGIGNWHLGNDHRLKLVESDGAGWIEQNKNLKFDFIFADTWHGKYLMLEEVLKRTKIRMESEEELVYRGHGRQNDPTGCGTWHGKKSKCRRLFISATQQRWPG
jgi:hypothetical protein